MSVLFSHTLSLFFPHTLSHQYREKLQARKALALQKQLEGPSVGGRQGQASGGFVTVGKTARDQQAWSSSGHQQPCPVAVAPDNASHLSALAVAANPAMLAALHAAKARVMSSTSGLPAQAVVQSTVRGVWAPSSEGVQPVAPSMPPYRPLGH